MAKRMDGSEAAFVARMNDMAHALGLRHTIYTDPSGFDEGTRSTAADQLVLANRAMQLSEFAALVALPSFDLPVAGTVHNTDNCSVRTGSWASRPARTTPPALFHVPGAPQRRGSDRRSCWDAGATISSPPDSMPPGELAQTVA